MPRCTPSSPPSSRCINARRGLSEAKDKLAAWQPSGPTALADYPTVLLSGDWLSREQITAASEFDRFLRKPESLGELVKAGFRADADGAELPKSDVVAFGDLAAPLAAGDNGTSATIADAVSAPVRSPAVTILLDQSMSTAEGGKSRVDNVAAALNARLQTLPPSASVGLWTFDGVAGRSEVAAGPLGDPVNGQPRSAALSANLDGQTASTGGAVSFTTLRLLYPDAVANFREGQENSILVITSGPHTDQSLDGAGLQEFVQSRLRARSARRHQRHRLRCRPRPRYVGGGRAVDRRHLPEPRQFGRTRTRRGDRHGDRVAPSARGSVRCLRRTPRPAGTSTPGCGRRTRRRCGAPAATPSAR